MKRINKQTKEYNFYDDSDLRFYGMPTKEDQQIRNVKLNIALDKSCESKMNKMLYTCNQCGSDMEEYALKDSLAPLFKCKNKNCGNTVRFKIR